MAIRNQAPPTGDEEAGLERALANVGSILRYPPTPDITGRVLENLDLPRMRTRSWFPSISFFPRVAFVVIAAVFALVLLFAYPDARDALAQFIGLRTVRIIPVASTPTPSPNATGTLMPRSTITPTASTTTLTQCCETTLDDVRTRTRYKVWLPPGDLPVRVYFQQLPTFADAQQVILIFGNPTAPTFTLYEATDFIYGKVITGGTVVEELTVHGERAIWLSGAPIY